MEFVLVQLHLKKISSTDTEIFFISSGMEVLKKGIGLEVDKYYATEIDEKAKKVTSFNYGDKVIQLGNVEDITVEKIKALCPIDLLIGGTPCQDLSAANVNRKPFGKKENNHYNCTANK